MSVNQLIEKLLTRIEVADVTQSESDSDDLYIPDSQNAHIALGMRDDEIAEAYQKRAAGFALRSMESVVVDDWMDRLAFFYDDAIKHHTLSPSEPSDDALVSRLLSAEKFIWFLASMKVHFASCSGFKDKEECVLHPDLSDHYGLLMDKLPSKSQLVTHFDGSAFKNDLLTAKIARTSDAKLSDSWQQFQRDFGRQWAISCWTCRPDGVPYLNDLMTQTYARGNYGVEIRVRYGPLKQALFANSILPASIDGLKYSGYVNYDATKSYLPPFQKRRTFEVENEVRFAYRCAEIGKAEVDVSEIFKLMRVFPAPDAPSHHERAIFELWEKFGGVTS